MNRLIFRVFVLFLLFGNIFVVSAQTVPQAQPVVPQTTSSTPVQIQNGLPDAIKNPTNISDAQLLDMAQKAQSSGMSDEQVRQMAVQRGMSPADVDALQNRVNSLRRPGSNNNQLQKGNTARRLTNDTVFTNTKVVGLQINGLPIFGSELFNNTNLTFEPNLRIATPVNYRLGPDDQLVIDVFGKSQVEWKPIVTPEGNIQLPGIGPLNVGGKTIEQVNELIKAKLISNHYSIGNGTNFSLGIGNIRTIRVKLVGEIQRPGTYNLSSFSTVFNALYQSGGPNINGSFRQIEVIRNNKLFRTLDVYDFLLKASQKDDIKLEDGDIIRVPTYNVHVSMTGQVKRQAVYEVLPGETLRDVIRFAGGFSDIAYTATIKAVQLTDQDKKIKEIKAADFGNYIPLRGDEYIVDKILNAFENRVTIAGAVVRPNVYELDKDLTLNGLIKKASGLKPDAFQSRGYITRLKSDNTTEIIPFDVKGIVNKTITDIPLKKEDVVTIPSIFDLRDQYTVTINGDVRAGGVFQYSDNMRVEDLVSLAGGFAESASPKRIEIGRRIENGNPGNLNTPVSQIFTVNVDRNLKLNDTSFVLKPFDVVSVFNLPGYEIQRTVQIQGEVYYPGPYTIKSKDERISDIVMRAGGLTAAADVTGGTLKRSVAAILGADDNGKIDAGELQTERLERLQRIKNLTKDSTITQTEVLHNDFVGIDLKQILQNPRSTIDLIVEEGDVIRIPKQQQVVRVNGQVLYPSSVVYQNNKSFNSYVDNAGGYSSDALKRKAYVVYPNGTVKGTRKFLFFNSHPLVKSGSEIFVPKKPENKSISPTEILGFTTGLASLGAIILGIISLNK
jgi:protein involved in polysaccharide export with SLBB domain